MNSPHSWCQDQQAAEIESIIAGNSCKIGIQQVVALFIESSVMDAENLVKLRAIRFDLRQIEVVDHHGE